MAVSLSSPVTGGLQTGLTSPTYTLTADTGPNAFSKQWAVTALGGTQTGVRTHAGSDPFTITIERPANTAVVPVLASGATLGRVPRNEFKFRVRKGVVCVVGQAPQVCIMELRLSIPAGSDAADAVNIRAAASALIGSLSQVSSGVGDTTVTAII